MNELLGERKNPPLQLGGADVIPDQKTMLAFKGK
jgi:hypothetical protein